MAQTYNENIQNPEVQGKSDAELREEILQLRKTLESKEVELKNTLEKAPLKNEILAIQEKNYPQKIEREPAKETIEKGSEAENAHFENLIMRRSATAATAQQVKKVTLKLKDADVAHQLSILTNLALNKGIYYAVKLARKIGNAYLLDRFHDAIVNELYDDLIFKKKLRRKK